MGSEAGGHAGGAALMASREAGQASLELLAGLPALLLAGLVCLQLLAAGYALTLADGAAEAGALAVAAGLPATPAARRALPGWIRARAIVSRRGGEVRVRLRPPAIVPGLDRALRVESKSWARQARRGPG